MPVEPIIFIKYDRNAPPTSDARSYIRGYAKKLKGTRTDEGYSAEEYNDAFKFNTWPTAGKFMSIANNQADVTAWKNSNPINAQKEINMSKGSNFSSSSIKIQYRKDKRDEVIKFLIGANIRWSDLGDNFMKITSLDNVSVESKISGMPFITQVESNFSSNINSPVRMRKKLFTT